jgi:K(+)-stimulated pyrophosphate-energized sodium pump
MNILIKLMSIVSLVIAPTLATIYQTHEGTASRTRPVEKLAPIKPAPAPTASVTLR